MQRLCWWLICSCLAPWCAAQPLAILGKNEILDLAIPSSTAPVDPAKAAFLTAFRVAVATGLFRDERVLPLENPPSWGKTLSDATKGSLHYRQSFAGGFVCRLQLEHLAPNHRYILTLNGNPERAGNDRLTDPVPGNERERYYDFLPIETDAAGRYAAALGIFLPAGPFDVRVYVKDAADFKIVLYRDFFRFTVE